MGFVSRQNEWGHPGLSEVREGCCLTPLLTCRQGGGSCLPFEQSVREVGRLSLCSDFGQRCFSLRE